MDRVNKHKLSDEFFKSNKKQLFNVRPSFVLRRYYEYKGDGSCLTLSCFDEFDGDYDRYNEANKKLVVAQKCYENLYSIETQEAYQEALKALYSALIDFLACLSEKEIKRLQGAYRQQKRRDSGRYGASNKYTGEIHKNHEIGSIARELNLTKKAAAEFAIDFTNGLVSSYCRERLEAHHNQSVCDLVTKLLDAEFERIRKLD